MSTLTIYNRELFGPLLSVVPVKDLEDAIALINSMYLYSVHFCLVNAYAELRDEPLNIYIFTNDDKVKHRGIMVFPSLIDALLTAHSHGQYSQWHSVHQ